MDERGTLCRIVKRLCPDDLHPVLAASLVSPPGYVQLITARFLSPQNPPARPRESDTSPQWIRKLSVPLHSTALCPPDGNTRFRAIYRITDVQVLLAVRFSGEGSRCPRHISPCEPVSLNLANSCHRLRATCLQEYSIPEELSHSFTHIRVSRATGTVAISYNTEDLKSSHKLQFRNVTISAHSIACPISIRHREQSEPRLSNADQPASESLQGSQRAGASPANFQSTSKRDYSPEEVAGSCANGVARAHINCKNKIRASIDWTFRGDVTQ